MEIGSHFQITYRIDGNRWSHVHGSVYLMNTQIDIFLVIVVIITAVIIISTCVRTSFRKDIRFGILGIRKLKPCCINTEFNHIQQRFLMQVIRFSESQGNTEIVLPFGLIIQFIRQSLAGDIADIKVLGSLFPYSFISRLLFSFLYPVRKITNHLQQRIFFLERLSLRISFLSDDALSCQNSG